MLSWAKILLAILLLPVCLGASQAMFWVLMESRPATPLAAVSEGASLRGTGVEGDGGAVSMTLVPLLAGAACWVVVFLMLPRPMWVYVFGHELTHAIWAWIFEARIKRFHVSSRGGHVVLDKVNFLIVLAPYFFPLYALCLALVYAIGCWLWGWETYRTAFLLLLGAAYGFHITLTGHALKGEQTDITSQGWFFSIVVIWLGNLAILIPGLCLLLGVPMRGAGEEWVRATWRVVRLVVWWS